MPTPTLPIGPYRVIPSVEGLAVPYYIVPFDADGINEAPQTTEHLLAAAAAYSDIFVFSHGWNNDWSAATARYEDFIQGVQSLRRELHPVMPADYRPLLVGVFWPSQALAWFDSETGPGFAAGGGPAEQDGRSQAETDLLRDIAGQLPAAARRRFYELARAPALNAAEANELAACLAAVARADDEGARDGAPTAADLLAAARSLSAPEPDFDAVGTAGGASGGPQAAGLFDGVLAAIDPRNLLKPFTVWQMKDRAGVVGHAGLGPLLAALLARSQARIHLLGHSFGCKVVMSALCAPAQPARPVESALLLQPAVSQYAFAATVPDRDRAGGFHRALDRVRQPIVATYSGRDTALTQLFHVAVRRADDLGELQFAAEGGTPSRYGAMGGFGAQASQARFVPIADAGTPYALPAGTRLVAIDGTRTISGHGDISNPSTWWLSQQLATGQLLAA